MLKDNDFVKIEKQITLLYSDLELSIIQEITKRIANVGYINTVSYNNIVILRQMGFAYNDITRLIAEANNTNIAEIENIFENAGLTALKRDNKIYKSAGIKDVAISNKTMENLVNNAKKTGNNIIKLTNTIANTSQLQFINAVNKAYLETSTGSKSYAQAITDTVKNVSKQGAVIEYPSGAKRSVESAVRTNILTSINQTYTELELERGRELGWDLYEVSAHGGARPEHAQWQGKVYTEKELYDICEYETVTGLCGVNCRHTFSPYYKGSARTYSNKELKDYKNEKVTYNGQEISKYNASQMQRAMERNIRNNKKEIAGLQGILLSNNKDIDRKEIEDNLQKVKNKLKQNNSKLNDFVKQTNSKKDYSRLII